MLAQRHRLEVDAALGTACPEVSSVAGLEAQEDLSTRPVLPGTLRDN